MFGFINLIWAKKNQEIGEQQKSIARDESWSYFKGKENLSQNLKRIDFELNKGNAFSSEQIDKWGAYRHIYTNAKFTKIFGADKAKAFADGNELVQLGSVKIWSETDHSYKPGNHPLDRRMDLKNNSIGRQIGATNKNPKDLLDETYKALSKNKRVILNQSVNNDLPYKDTPIMKGVWGLADKAYYLNEQNKKSKQWQKFYGDEKFKKLEPAKLDHLKNPPIAGVANNNGVVDGTQMLVTYPQAVSSGGGLGWMAQLGSILSGAATVITAGFGAAAAATTIGNATSSSSAVAIDVSNTGSGYGNITWPSSIKPFHTGGIVVPSHKGGRNEMMAVLQGGETIRTEAQEKELQEAKQKELIEAFAPLVSGEGENDPYAQVFGGNQTKKKDPKMPVLANKTRYDEEMIIAIIADAWKTNRSGFRNILRYN